MNSPDRGHDRQVDSELFVELLEQGHLATTRASGTSMLPSIRPGALLEIAPPPFEPPLRTGDLVLVHHDGVLCVHRLIAIEGRTRYQTKGDGRLRPDPQLAAKNLLGRVQRVNGRSTMTRPQRRLGAAIATLSSAQWRAARTSARLLRRLLRRAR